MLFRRGRTLWGSIKFLLFFILNMFDYIFNHDSKVGSLVKFVNSKYKTKKVLIDKRTNAILKHFSVPSYESGALDLIKKAFPKYSKLSVSGSNLKPKEVLDADKDEVKIYCKRKKLKLQNKEILREVIMWIRNNYIFESSEESVPIECLDALPKNTSTGYPEYRKKGNKLSMMNCIRRMFNVIKMAREKNIYEFMQRFPTTIFHRFTPKYKWKASHKEIKPKWKIRQIFGVPYFIVALEYFVFKDVVDSFKKSFSSVYTVGCTKLEVSSKVAEIRNLARSSNSVIMCGDISGCDKSISKTHSLFYFSFFSKYIRESRLPIFKALAKYFVFNPILYSHGLDYSHGSTVTGSWITSSFTTFSVMIPLLYSFKKRYDRFPNMNEFLIQGDDFVLILENESDKKFIKDCFGEFNLRLRLDATRVVMPHEDIEFLGYFWDYNNEPYQTDDWIVTRVLFPERFVKFTGPKRIIYRYLSIFIQLRNFRNLFAIFIKVDYELRKMYNEKIDPKFNVVDNHGNVLEVKIPISLYLKDGWRIL